MRHLQTSMLGLVLLLVTAQVANAGELGVEGVFGLSPMPESAALAIWIPLEEGESIAGIRWYNNDGDLPFPRILAVAGEADRPELLADAVVVGENVGGNHLAWTDLVFSQALATGTTGLYVIFEMPLDGEFDTEGVGAGIGYAEGDGEIRGWIATTAVQENLTTAPDPLEIPL